jgi:hypothetical protein
MAAETLYHEKRLSVSAFAGKLHISKSTLYGYLRHRGVDIGPYNKPAYGRSERATRVQGDRATATVLLSLRAFETDLRNCFSESNAQLEGSQDRTW